MQCPAVVLFNKASGDPFPCIKELYELYSRKGIRTVFLSVGASPSCMVDLEIAETIGCPVNAICTTEAEFEAWSSVKECLKTHKALAEPTPFSEGAHTKWILPKNLRVYMDSGSGPITDLVGTVCKAMSISESDTRIDILKVDLTARAGAGAERQLLFSVLDAGFRPATILIRWGASPDESPPTKLVAGHLQNCGYALTGKEGNKYLYFFVDNDMYATCSWEQVGAVNPMVDGIVNEVLEQVRAQRTAATVEENTIVEAENESESEKTDDEQILATARTLVSDLATLVKSSPTPLASTLALAKTLGLAQPMNNTYTGALFHTWISKLFEKLDAMTLEGDARASRKEILASLKAVEAMLEEVTTPRAVDVTVSTTTDAC